MITILLNERDIPDGMEIDLTSDPASAQDALGSARRDLKDETTWHPPDEVLISDFITKKGRKLNLTIWGGKEMLMKGTSNYKMNRHPFTLLQITITDEQGNNVWKPMWLIVIGARRFGVKS